MHKFPSFPPYLRWLERYFRFLKPTVTSSSSPIPPQTRDKLGRFRTKAQQINQLTAQLEASIWELKDIATQINQDRYLDRLPSSQTQICTYRSVQLPVVQQKADRYILTSYSLDLFKAEREAVSLAKTLRQRAKKKRRQRKSRS